MPKEKNPIKNLFEDDYGHYPKKGSPYYQFLAEELFKNYDFLNALDVGCNTGGLVYALRSLNIDSYGVDISNKAISNADHSIKDYLTIVDIDYELLPYNNNNFDLIILHQVLQHLQRPGKIIADCYRVLKPNGIIFVMTPTPPFEFKKLWKKIRIVNDIEHINDHSKSFWINVFELNGFKYIGNLNSTISKAAHLNIDPPSFWVGKLLLKFGFVGRNIWKYLSPFVRGTMIFKKLDIHPDVSELCKKRNLK